jgi:glycosyltransferase involved in cell wall biosynthesis
MSNCSTTNPAPKVSVIIPIYNTDAYLSEALDSICNQTLKELEIILINDGSTDKSQNIIEEYAVRDSRIQWHIQPNQGQGVARNHGLQYATGEYIYFMDSDDILDTTALQQCYDACEQKKLDFVFFDAETIMETPAYLPDYNRKNKINDKIWKGTELLEYELNQYIFSAPCWLCFTRHSFIRKYFTGFPVSSHEDHIFVIQIHLYAQRVAYINQTFFKRRVRPNSTMTNNFSMRDIEGYSVICSKMLSLRQQHPEWTSIIDKYLWQTLNAIIWNAHRMTFLEKIETVCRFRRLSFNQYITFRHWLVFWFKRSHNFSQKNKKKE